MKKYLMFIFLVLFCSTLSARYIFDGKIIFSKHATNKDSLAYLIIEKAGGVLDTFATIDTSGTVIFHYSFLELFLEDNLWLMGDTLFFTDGGADTSWIVQDGTYLTFGGDNNFQFLKASYFGSHIYGNNDVGLLRTAGWQWLIDHDNDDALAFISFHNEDSAKVDTSDHVMEWTGIGGIHADVMVSVASDTIASVATLVLTNHNNFVITGTADIDSIDQSCAFPNWAIAYIEFTGAAAANGLVDGKNLKLNGAFAYSPDDMIIIQRRGNIFYEMSRSAN